MQIRKCSYLGAVDGGVWAWKSGPASELSVGASMLGVCC